MSTWIFYLLATGAIASALAVVLARNPVRSALSLVLTMGFLAVFYASLSAHLVAALQIMVYAGAVMVLFLFVITLLNLQPDPDEVGRPLMTSMALVSCLLLGSIFASAVWQVTLPTGGVAPDDFGQTAAVARQLFGENLLAFELTSILLLVAVVGAVVLAQYDAPESEV